MHCTCFQIQYTDDMCQTQDPHKALIFMSHGSLWCDTFSMYMCTPYFTSCTVPDGLDSRDAARYATAQGVNPWQRYPKRVALDQLQSGA